MGKLETFLCWLHEGHEMLSLKLLKEVRKRNKAKNKGKKGNI